MSPFSPFVDRSGSLDTDRILAEALPIASLIALFSGIALVPFLLVALLGPTGPLGVLFTVVAQFVLAVGTGVVLLHVLVRAHRLSGGAASRGSATTPRDGAATARGGSATPPDEPREPRSGPTDG